MRGQRREAAEEARNIVVGVSAGGQRLRRHEREALFTPEERVRNVQRYMMRTGVTLSFLAGINALTSHFPWVLFPALGMGISLASRIGGLWVDGIPLRKLFSRQPYVPHTESEHGRAPRPFAPPPLPAPDLGGIPRDVLEGPHGAVIREAAESKVVIADVLAKLSAADREMLPAILPTVETLVERVRSLAQDLHQLDTDASPEAIAKLEVRVADAKALPTDPAVERRLQLLERQLATLRDLASRRARSAEQLESASLVLQTMKLDLLKLRSSGNDQRLEASTDATQEARALSSDIGRVIDAANEVRKL